MPPDDLFTCGLLHDFGWLVGLISFERLLTKLPTNHPRSAAGVDGAHRQVPHRAGNDGWRENGSCPPLALFVIAFHHQPDSSTTDRATVDLVAASDAVVALLETRSFDLGRGPGWHPPSRQRGVTSTLYR